MTMSRASARNTSENLTHSGLSPQLHILSLQFSPSPRNFADCVEMRSNAALIGNYQQQRARAIAFV